MRCRGFALFDSHAKSGVEASLKGSGDLPLSPFECVTRPITLNLIQHVTRKNELHCLAAFILWYQNEQVPGTNLVTTSDCQRWRWLTVKIGLIWQEITSDSTKNRLPLSDQGALGWFTRATAEQQKKTGDGPEKGDGFLHEHWFRSSHQSCPVELIQPRIEPHSHRYCVLSPRHLLPNSAITGLAGKTAGCPRWDW